jgi:hypothetical protein
MNILDGLPIAQENIELILIFQGAKSGPLDHIR